MKHSDSDDEIHSDDGRSSTQSSEYHYSEGSYDCYADDKTMEDSLLPTALNIEANEYLFLSDDDDVLKYLDEEVEDVGEFIGEDYASSICFLRKHKWDKIKAKEAFLHWVAESTAAEDFKDRFDLAKARITLDVNFPEASQEDEQCFVCCENISASNPFVSLGCDHYFCLSCYASYWGGILTTDSTSTGRPDPFSLKCMQHDASMQCNLIATPPVVIELFTLFESLSTPGTQLKPYPSSFVVSYKKWLRTIFVEESASLQTCASAGSTTNCDLVIRKPRLRSTTGRDEYSPCMCRCGFEFCFGCYSTASHNPATCTAIRNFNAIASSQETSLLLMRDTKRCPNCTMVIEKNGGCNHMRCRSCQHEFCWVCLQHCPRHQHPAGGCNKPPRDINAEERWKHYWNRYVAHRESETHEKKSLELRIAKLAPERDDLESDQLVVSCTETLLVCRSTLKYTYVHAHCLSEESRHQELSLFECQQQDLENHTERLSRLVAEACADHPRAPINTTVCPVPSCHQIIDTKRRPKKLWKLQGGQPTPRHASAAIIAPADFAAFLKPTVPVAPGVKARDAGAARHKSQHKGNANDEVAKSSLSSAADASSSSSSICSAGLATVLTRPEGAAASRAVAAITCPKCTYQFCAQCYKQCPQNVHPAIACVASRAPGSLVSCLPGHLVVSLRNQQSAAMRFLSNLLSGENEAFEMGGGASSSSEATALVVAGSKEAAIVHSSWYCAICSESKKSCCCVVSEIMRGDIGDGADSSESGLEGFSDRSEVERVLLQTNSDKKLAIALLKRKRDAQWDERHNWFEGVRPPSDN